MICLLLTCQQYFFDSVHIKWDSPRWFSSLRKAMLNPHSNPVCRFDFHTGLIAVSLDTTTSPK
ncbi:hypothetical protein CRENPOLYSF2_1340007 [Crenothrix polyspora]|uniref:Uncharacterized protein n=1 Tax=Crenothrix polyspora TaxID=360316 RepID=A0A1R4H0P9_9GAMM|nr:hypothetical protein CRENPOLYSF2_1340007 [Crenothrix polyspora]